MCSIDKLSVWEMRLSKPYKIGTVETLKVKSSGRRLYLNLDAETVQSFGIMRGDILKVRIEEGYRPDTQGRPET